MKNGICLNDNFEKVSISRVCVFFYTLLFLLVNCLLCHYGCVGFCNYCGGKENSAPSVRGSEENNDIKIEVYKKGKRITITCQSSDFTLEKTADGKVDGKQIVNGNFINSGRDVYYSQVDNEDTYGVFIGYLKSKNGEAISVESGFWRRWFLGEQMNESTTYLFALVTVNEVQYLVYCENANSITLIGSLFGVSEATKIEILSCGSEIENMSWMFYNCSKLTNIIFHNNFDNNKVTDMSNMFYYCSQLTSITFSDNFKTNRVTNMYNMFYNCISLQGLNLSNWDTSNVTDMRNMFYNCSQLINITFSDNFKTNRVTNMYNMFYNCNSLKKLNLSNWDTGNVKNMSYMFYNCSSLKELDLSNFDTINVENMSCMFENCSSLNNITFSNNFKTNNVKDMRGMFYKCSSLLKLDLSNFDTSNVTDMGFMFSNCSSLQELYLSNWDTSNVTDMSYMFYGCSSLPGLNLSNWDTSRVTDMQSMFENCSNLTVLDLSKFNIVSVNYMYNMFTNCFKAKNWNILICPGGIARWILLEIREGVNIRYDVTIYKCIVERNEDKDIGSITKAVDRNAIVEEEKKEEEKKEENKEEENKGKEKKEDNNNNNNDDNNLFYEFERVSIACPNYDT